MPVRVGQEVQALPREADLAPSPGSGCDGLRLPGLARDERSDALDRVEVLGQHLAVLYRDREGRLDEHDDFQYAGGVDDAVVEQRGAILQGFRLGNVEVGDDEVADLLLQFHQFPLRLILRAATTRTSPAAFATVRKPS